MIYVFLANGFEELEALTPVDLLRRAGTDVATVGIGSKTVTGAHGIPVIADMQEADVALDLMDAVVLPGGIPGTLNLEASDTVQRTVAYAVEKNLPGAAICAAPSILGNAHYLNGIKATCYPGFEEALIGADVVDDAVVTDGIFTTAKGAGVAVEFALELVKRFKGAEISEEIRSSIQCR